MERATSADACRRSPRRWMLGAAVVLTTVSCTDRGSAPALSVRDSAGVAIVENDSPVWSDGQGWRVTDRPLVQIGVVDGAPEYQFQGIQGALVTGAGEIAVAEWGSRQIRFYDAEGRHLRSRGGQGGGPGEYERIGWLGEYVGDSLLVYDLAQRRISVLARDGTFGRVLPAPSLQPFALVVGHLQGGAIVRTVATYQTPAELPGSMRETRHVLRLLPDGSREDTLLAVAGAERMMYRSGPMATMAPRPFGAAAHFAARDSLWYVSTVEEFRIDVRDGAGRLVRSIRLPHERRRVTPDDIARHREGRRPLQGAAQGSTDERDQLPHPERMPAHGPILVDAERHLWVQDYAAEHETERVWSVFDPEGRFLGRVRTPEAEIVHWIGRDRFVTVWRDELDVPFVRVYGLSRSERTRVEASR